MLYESDMYKYIVLQKSRQKKLVTGYGRQDSPSTPSSLKVTLHHTTNVITPNCKFVVKTDSRETGTLIQISKQSYDKSIIKRKHKLLMWSLVFRCSCDRLVLMAARPDDVKLVLAHSFPLWWDAYLFHIT